MAVNGALVCARSGSSAPSTGPGLALSQSDGRENPPHLWAKREAWHVPSLEERIAGMQQRGITLWVSGKVAIE